MKKGIGTTVFKNENLKNIENWACGELSNFEISKYYKENLEFSFLFRKYETLVYRVVLSFVDALMVDSLTKKLWQNL